MAEASCESCPEWERVLIPGHGRAGRTSRVQFIATRRKGATSQMKILAQGFLPQENGLFTDEGRDRDWLTRLMGIVDAQQF